MKTLPPVVGYQGGKRRLLPRLREVFDVSRIGHYVEPFVGMGANYLDLRARGYEGPAILADTNPQVRWFWRYVHGDCYALLDAVDALEEWPRTPEGYAAMLSDPVASGPARVARFLWITNYAFGNVPPAHNGEKWTNTTGTKLTSAEKWGKTFPWDKCVARLRSIVERLNDADAVVTNSADIAVSATRPDSWVYCDPPYAGTSGYHVATGDHVDTTLRASGTVVLSEASDLSVRLGPEWVSTTGDVTARLSYQQGATGKRQELIYVRQPA